MEPGVLEHVHCQKFILAVKSGISDSVRLMLHWHESVCSRTLGRFLPQSAWPSSATWPPRIAGAIRESKQALPTDSGFTTGLARLRIALTLMYDDDFEHPEGESSSMEPDSQPNDTYAPAPPHDDERPTTTSISRARP